MLGWPNPVPYFENYGTSDDEHRSDNLLLGVYALTQSPSLKETILAMIENEKMNIQLRKGDAPIGAPRGWGRPLLSLSHMLALGFNDVRPMINFYVDYLYRNASMFKIPQTPQHSVRTIASNGGKYGWKELSGNDIRAWVPWEESILVIGLYAIYNTTGNTKALQLALEISKTISKHAFFKSGQNWFACYAVRWDASNPGIPLPDSSYVLTNPPYGGDKTNKSEEIIKLEKVRYYIKRLLPTIADEDIKVRREKQYKEIERKIKKKRQFQFDKKF